MGYPNKRYEQLADQLQTLIRDQVYPVGSRLPGVRKLGEQHGVSVATVVSACRELEQRGVLEALIMYFGGLTQSLLPSLMEHLSGNNKKIVIEMDIKLIQKFY
ncbi:MAG: winged helix-turn-helix transcriptional regulator [Alcanivorax sp.]|nr:winged helix-turn-helix transcriptional regulator [Alcanivorax sp.]